MAEIIDSLNLALNTNVTELYNVAGKLAEEPADLQITGDLEGFYFIKSSAYYFLFLDEAVKSYLVT